MSDNTAALNFIGLFLFIVFIASVVLLTRRVWTEDISWWYRDIIFPVLKVPDIVFKITWPIMFALVIASGYLIWQLRLNEDVIGGELVIIDSIGKDEAYLASLCLWLISVFIAAIWVPVFFVTRNLIGAVFALILIFLNVAVSLGCMILFYVLWWVPGLIYTPFFVWLIVVTYFSARGVYAVEIARRNQRLSWLGVTKAKSRSKSVEIRYH